MKTLKEAREAYKNNEITFLQLDVLFWELASEEEIDEFCSAPVYDRAGVVIGYTKKQLDNEFNNLIK